MWIYILICLSLSLAGAAGLQFFYVAYLYQIQKEHLKHIRQLEIRNRSLTKSLNRARRQAAGERVFIRSIQEGEARDDVLQDEIWADVIEEG
jgi:hypothetical protein